MKKIEKRAIMCLMLAGVLVIGLGIFCFRYVKDGADWATYVANKQIYNDKGRLSTGTLNDRNGTLLMTNTGEKMKFSDDKSIRKATVHLTGDRNGNIVTGANKVFADKLSGYNPLFGTYSLHGDGRNVNLTIDADLCATANDALDGRQGTVGVYNYETGEILCAVSSPNYDPSNPPKLDKDDKSGLYLNRFFSTTFVPGSIFKLVTAAASIENYSKYATWEFDCTGEERYGKGKGERVTCQKKHGRVTLEQALADSCNCYFGKLTELIGPKVMNEYVEKTGLTISRDINGISTAQGSFQFPNHGVRLAWAGIGQHNDMVNPCTMMTYMGAIAGGGRTVQPKILRSVKFSNGLPAGFSWKSRTKRMIEEETATILKNMMRNNVEENYGVDNFPDLSICAKSGTAEVQKDQKPHAWFTGFLDDQEHPYAFIVLVEKGGFGSDVAGKVANKVLQEVVDKY